jgi:hypothetical protein
VRARAQVRAARPRRRHLVFVQQETIMSLQTPTGGSRLRFHPLPEDGGRGPFMPTFTGLRFHPRDPRPEEIDVRDIARGLSRQCRYAGQVRCNFLSTAEHSVLVSQLVPTLAGLLHDAAEAYLTDLPRATKAELPHYLELEARAMRAIAARFGFAPEITPEIRAADDAVAYLEEPVGPGRAFDAAHGLTDARQAGVAARAGLTLRGLDPDAAERLFLDRLEELAGRPASDFHARVTPDRQAA